MPTDSPRDWIAPPEWLVNAFTPANEFLDDEEWNDALILLWGALLEKGSVRTKYHHVRGHPMFPQTDDEYPYEVLELRLTEPRVPTTKNQRNNP